MGLDHDYYSYFILQVENGEDITDGPSEEEQEPEVWEDVSLQDLLFDVENNDPCPEPTPKRSRTQ